MIDNASKLIIERFRHSSCHLKEVRNVQLNPQDQGQQLTYVIKRRIAPIYEWSRLIIMQFSHSDSWTKRHLVCHDCSTRQCISQTETEQTSVYSFLQKEKQWHSTSRWTCAKNLGRENWENCVIKSRLPREHESSARPSPTFSPSSWDDIDFFLRFCVCVFTTFWLC